MRNLPRDVFIHLLTIGTLYASVISFLTLMFQYVEVGIPDPLKFDGYYYYTAAYDSIRWAIAVLLVVFPLFLYLSRILENDFARQPEKRESRIRKWLVYFTLFLAAVTVIISIILLIYNFLGGDLTIQFLLRMLSVLLVSAFVFGYYFWDLKRDITHASSLPKTLAWSSSGILMAAIVAGFFIVGTPGYQRDRRFDERRTGDLQTIQSQILNYWVQKRALPEDLTPVSAFYTGWMAPADPETGNPYGYRRTNELSFDVCANFSTETPEVLKGKVTQVTAPVYAKPIRGPFPISAEPPYVDWSHERGEKCFSFTINPDLYPPPEGK